MQLIKNGTLINCRLRHDVPWLYVGTQTPDSADPTPDKVQEPTSTATTTPPPPSIPLPPPNWAKLKAGWHKINENTQIQVSLKVAAFRTPSPHLDTTEYRWRTTWSFDGQWHLLDRDCEYSKLDNQHVFFGTVGKLITIFSKLDPRSGEIQLSSKRHRGKRKLRLCSTRVLPQHNEFTHFPRDPGCEICQMGKPHRAYCKTQNPDGEHTLPKPKKFGDAVVADHKILGEHQESGDGDRVLCIICDRFTRWLQAYPAPEKSAEEVLTAFQRFLGPQQTCEHVYTDNAKEYIKALKQLGLSQDTCTPHRSETNGIAESCVRKVKQGTSCCLIQSGLASEWWRESSRCFCFLSVAVDKFHDGFTAYHRRFGHPFDGPIYPFGCKVHYHPISDKDKARLHQFGAKTLPGIFVGYNQRAGGQWSGDLEVLDCGELETASSVTEVFIKRFKAK